MIRLLFWLAIILLVVIVPSCPSEGFGEYGSDGKPISLIDNPLATNPTYQQLIDFVASDNTNEEAYIKGGPRGFVCADFAEMFHNNAEANGIRAAWVGIDFENDEEGHACNAFETIDKGLVYIDCSSGDRSSFWNGQYYLVRPKPLSSFLYKETEIPDNYQNVRWDAIAYIVVGKEYGLIGIYSAGRIDYAWYEYYMGKWDRYLRLLDEYNQEVSRFNNEVSSKIYTYGTEEEKELRTWGFEIDKKEEQLDREMADLGYFNYSLEGNPGRVTNITIYWED